MMNVIIHDKKFQKAFQGKTIKIIAPASGIAVQKIKALQTLNTLNLGFYVDISEGVQDIDHASKIPYHAHSDEERIKQLKMALLDESNHIIWALRGGYGCARLLDDLQKLPVPMDKKILIGFSDITALHLFLSQKWSWRTIHGSGFSQILDPQQDPENFLKIAELLLERENHSFPFSHITPINECAENNSHENLSGELTGGNLTLVENSIGTHWQIQTKGKILCLEEVGERGYRVDRSLYHLYQAGIFNQVKAIILGQFLAPENINNIEIEGENYLINIALKRFAEDMQIKLKIPVYKTEQFGHGKVNYPWKL